ncbi:hypothetical protein ACIBG7_35885 [Nonomuraea sp. NPDC050328]|uniref:hypothetical protein n=1 Tax=Nonomuraea sp. NPDC050328 TaxID=3364361 RepID=UPI0037BBFACE
MFWEITGDERLAACLEKMPTGQLEEAAAVEQLPRTKASCACFRARRSGEMKPLFRYLRKPAIGGDEKIP